ncbi:lipoprotein-releasing system ATP-binding protein [Candidatus Kinetoplastibacterium oncopeltii TCC290E]|uniref:Lipoprotein-releasing system ATP-binding protein n=1 Tax=Candidatus Kinetoplastidibacterium stringomonadis TCC290E TaxID=1208920 RepID=M1LYV0_9PROT|nr:ATP-binding cassette domain-containing protein [Candidatus Kinetoplastibacterium oncopeltii]AGF48309.1 lipoprotein-releasing system ATP-binding protein [Candidatus Kinetoplastibacterium oncopeltii TCC290E]
MLNKNDYVLNIVDVCKSYSDQNNKINILNNINLSLFKSEILAIIGSSGSGKSTLLHIIGLLDLPDSGSIIINGLDTANFSRSEIDRIHNYSISFMYQFHHLLSEFNVLDNVALPIIIRDNSYEKARQLAENLLEKLGLRGKEKKSPCELSGGERQRVALARSLITKPNCVIADEPTGNLDKKNSMVMFDYFLEMKNEYGTSFIIATHDLELASKANIRMCLEYGNLSFI